MAGSSVEGSAAEAAAREVRCVVVSWSAESGEAEAASDVDDSCRLSEGTEEAAGVDAAWSANVTWLQGPYPILMISDPSPHSSARCLSTPIAKARPKAACKPPLFLSPLWT